MIDGAGGGLIAAWEIAKDPRAFVASLRDTIDMLVNDPGGFLGGIRDEFLASLTDPRALGALTFDAVLTATGAGAAYTSISRSGKVLKLIDKVRALDKRMGGNRGAALNPFAKGALSRGNRGRGGGAASAKQGADLKEHLRQTEEHGKGGTRELSDGRIRYYDQLKPADKPGEMAGRRRVREWNPLTGQKRNWHETLDHNGRVRQVRPIDDGNKIHYRFDASGNYIGSW